MKTLNLIFGRSLAGQMVAVLTVSFVGLLFFLTLFEQIGDATGAGEGLDRQTAGRFATVLPGLAFVAPENRKDFIRAHSKCHDGFEIGPSAFAFARNSEDSGKLAVNVAKTLKLDTSRVKSGEVILSKNRFGYSKCGPSEIEFPVRGTVISVRIAENQWLHAEIHPHEWHLRQSLLSWLQRTFAVFAITAVIAVFFILRLSKPIKSLAHAAIQFGDGLKIAHVAEAGSLDVRHTIRAFNAMQMQVAGEVDRRTNTLAALSHDLRTPLTGLRMKAELIADVDLRNDLLRSILRMELTANSALEFLRGETLDEPLRDTDLRALVESECAEAEERGGVVRFNCDFDIRIRCRPDAIARAVRNLIENAIKYGGSADVSIKRCDKCVEVVVVDSGPGIPPEKVEFVVEQFTRLDMSGMTKPSGFGMGLAVVKAIAEGHGGRLILRPRTPQGLEAVLAIPSAEKL